MPSEILKQLRALRDGTAEELRRDPRYLTLQALDKTIAEIAGVLKSAGQPATEEAGAPSALDLGRSRSASEPANQAAHRSAPASTHAADNAALLAAGDFAAEAIASEFQKRKAPGTEGLHAAGEREGEASDGDPDLSGEEHPPPHTTFEGEDGHAASAGPAALGEAGSVAERPFFSDGAEPVGDAVGSDHTAHGEMADNGFEPEAEGRSSGYLPMSARPGAPVYQPSIYVKFGKLPHRVDLRPLLMPVEDQGQIDSSVADAVASAYGLWVRKTTKQPRDLSRLFVYFNARWRDGAETSDGGATIQFAMESLARLGVCAEGDWPFHSDLVLRHPPLETFKAAAPFRAQDLAQVPVRLDAWRQAIAEGKPIVFGCVLFSSFDECSQRGGVVPMPHPDEVGQIEHAVHAMVAVGYCDSERVFIVRNSWGPDWGDGGYCYIPYAYLMSEKLNDGDCWIIVSKTPLQPPREAWSDTADPVTDGGRGVAFATEPFDADHYATLDLDLFEAVRSPYRSNAPESYSAFVEAAGRDDWDSLRRIDETADAATTADSATVEFDRSGWGAGVEQGSADQRQHDGPDHVEERDFAAGASQHS